jgi:hypothetical protein
MDYLLAKRGANLEIVGRARALGLARRTVNATSPGCCPTIGSTQTDTMETAVVPLLGAAGVEALFIPLVALVPAAIFFVVQYNALVRLRKRIAESWSMVETELKRRYDLIPNLVTAIQGHAAQEQEALERVTQLRNRCLVSRGSPSDQARD